VNPSVSGGADVSVVGVAFGSVMSRGIGSPWAGMGEQFFDQSTEHRVAAANHGGPGRTIAAHQDVLTRQHRRAGGGFGGSSPVAVDQHRHALIVRDHRDARGSLTWET
jgi:hypothetical protein